jgi:transposase
MESDILSSLHPFGVGIDVGKNEMVVCRRSSQSGLVATPTISIPNTTTGIKKLLREFKKQSVESDEPIVLESTGPYHWQAAHDLTQAGFLAKVINPLHTRHAIRNSIRKRKTDKIDAEHLAMLAYQNYGYPFRETREIAELKALTRHYWYLKHQHTGQMQHENYLRNYRGIKKFSTSEYVAKQIEALEPEILSRFKGNDLRYLDSIPGVTPILAATVLAELYPLNRFSKIEQIIAVSGLDPSVKQSGGKAAHFGKLSKRGSPLLRHALFCSIFGAFTREPWRSLYLNYKERGLHHIEVFCILSRKLLRIMWALLKKRREFDPKYLAVDKSV